MNKKDFRSSAQLKVSNADRKTFPIRRFNSASLLFVCTCDSDGSNILKPTSLKY